MEGWVEDGEDRQTDRLREGQVMDSWVSVGQMDGLDGVVIGGGQMDR